jgi:hypothetical protein
MLNSLKMSLPKSKKVHGIEVKKVPVGKYLEALENSRELSQVIIQDLFGNENLEEVFKKIANFDKDALFSLFEKAICVIPNKVIAIVSEILDVDYDFIINNITPTELMDVLEEFWKMNDMSRFFKGVWGQIKRMLLTQMNSYKAGTLPPQDLG